MLRFGGMGGEGDGNRGALSQLVLEVWLLSGPLLFSGSGEKV